MSIHGASFDAAQRAHDRAEPIYIEAPEPDITDPDTFHNESANFSFNLLDLGADILHMIAVGDDMICQPSGLYYIEDELIKKIQQYQREIWLHFQKEVA